jgi:hypothetical protein
MLFDASESLRPALQDAQRQLDAAADAIAQANAGGSQAVDAAMTRTAQAALFSEALIGAVHARFAEIKAATK